MFPKRLQERKTNVNRVAHIIRKSGWYLVFISVLFCVVVTPQLIAQPVTAPQLVRQGRQLYEGGQFEQALKSWQRAAEVYGKDTIGVTGSLIDQAQAWEAMGHQRQACKTLVQALQPNIATAQICDAVRTGNPIIQSTVMPLDLRANGLRNLGKVLRLVGNLEASQRVLLQSLALSPPKDRGTVLLRLGNTAQDLGNRARDRKDNIILTDTTETTCLALANPTTDAMSHYKQAVDCYQTAANTAQNLMTSVQSQLNHLSLLLDVEQWLRRNDQLTDGDRWLAQVQPQMAELVEKLPSQLDRLPNTHETSFAQINFARSLTHFYRQQNLESAHPKWQQIRQRLEGVATQAKALGDQRAEGYAIAHLGWFNEQIGQLPTALAQTEAALQLVQNLQAPDINYQWEWQRGRILARQKRSDRAIQAYDAAVQALQLTRGDLIAVNPDAQFSLRDMVEPIYREYISLLLPVGKNPAQENIQKSLQLIDSLQLAELEDFFRCNLLQAKQVQVDQVEDPTAAVFHVIILDDRIEIILKLPQQTELIRETSLVKRSELEQQLGLLREQLKDRSSGADVQKTAQLIYDWLLRSTKPHLEASNIKTLVFVLDGSLRGIPMAALYDGQHYLVEKYAVAITPGLQLLGAKRNLSRSGGVLIAGLTTGSTITVGDRPIRFSPLANVLQEVQQIKALLPNSEVLLDAQFTTEKFRSKVGSSSYAIVHVATHGQFSSNPDETFIITASAQPVDVNELQTILQKRSQIQSAPVELLVFSACETASGDKRAALGLAGVAIRAGAFGTLASLWAVDDASTTSLMGQFYQAFSRGNSQLSKAEVLQRAQLSLLYGRANASTANLQKRIEERDNADDADFSHPYFWAPFVLVGNWL